MFVCFYLSLMMFTIVETFSTTTIRRITRANKQRLMQMPLRMFSSDKDLLSQGSPTEALSILVKTSLNRAFDQEVSEKGDPLIFPAKHEFGDYQCNAALPLGKILNQNPRDIAETLMKSMKNDNTGLIKSMDISGPGFINIRLSDEYVTSKLNVMLSDATGRLAIQKYSSSVCQKVIVDFSSPNIAKEMHVGHLRSTIIGDSLSRLLTFLGHDVLRLNHVGDWGTQFGMLITYLKENGGDDSSSAASVRDLVTFYKNAKKRFDADENFQKRSREEVVKLQNGDKNSLESWRQICGISRKEFQVIYDRLNIKQLEERGESFYNPYLDEILQMYVKSGVARESEGAICIFLPGYSNADGTPMPMIIQKSDGGFLYATTDLAAIQHRIDTERADRVLYVTDVGQSQHFKMVFEAAAKGGLISKKHSLEHVPFGLVQGEDGKKFKTRSGDTVRLKDLLDEAVDTAEQLISAREGIEPSALSAMQKKIASVVGIGAVKYADLSMNRESNYRFSFKKMLSLQGNTAPYMLYAYARIQGIRRKALTGANNDCECEGDKNDQQLSITSETLIAPEELALGKHLLKLEEVLKEVERNLYPNALCEYLYELSSLFNKFYEKCPVLKAETQELRASRTALCSLSADALSLGLGLLGIDTLEQL